MKIHVCTKYILLILAFVTLASGCLDKENQEAAGHIKKARNFMSQQKPETAITEYQSAVKLDPNNDVALFELAEAYILTRQINKAVRYYNLAAKANPHSTLSYLRLAQIYMQTDQLLEARENISRVLNISPLSIEAHHLLSSIQIKERDMESAIETLNKAISMDPENIRTYISLAKLYVKTGAVDKAIHAYGAAVFHDPSSREAYMGLVEIYAYQKEWDQIENLLKKVVETEGRKIEKYTDLARFYEGRKKDDLAEENYQKAVLAGEDKIEPLINLSEFYAKRGQMDKAVLMMKNALAKQKNNPLLHTALSQIYIHFNRVDEAQEAVNEALRLDDNYVDALFQQGRILMLKQDYKKALDTFDEVLAINKIHAKAYYYRALCIKQRGATDRPEQKIFRAAAGLLNNPEEFERDQIKGNLLAAIAVNPTLLDARLKLTEIYILEKNLNKAKEQLEEIFRIAPPDIRVMNLLSGIRLLEGDSKEAEKILKAIIQEQPDYAPAHIRLGMLYRSMDQPEQALESLKKAYALEPAQTGLVKMMVGILMSENKTNAALDLVNTYMPRASGGSTADVGAFFENLKGEIFLQAGNRAQALDHFFEATRQMPDFINPRMHIARDLVRENQLHKALEEYRIIETNRPSFLPALMSMGTLYDRLKNNDKAEEYYRKVLAINPRHPDAANNLAFLLSENQGSIEEAFTLAKIAREQRPKDPNVLDTMGWVYYQKGNYLNALSELEESLKRNPESPLASFHYGMALYRNQKFEQARQFFKKALDLDPKFKDAEKAREMLN